MTTMRGHAVLDKQGKVVSGGELVFFFDDEGHAVGLDLYRDWVKGGVELRPGEELHQ